MQSQQFGKLVVTLLLAIFISEAARGQGQGLTAEKQLIISNALSRSLVRVEYTLRIDKGEAAEISGWARLCPNCGSYHPISGGDELVVEERPLEISGYLISPTVAATTDVMIHPRFVETIQVRFGEDVVEAEPMAYAKTQNMILLKLKRPLEGTEPLTFDISQEGPYHLISYEKQNSTWTTIIQSLGESKISKTEDGHIFQALPGDGVITASNGIVVGLCLDNKLPVDDSWKGSPLEAPLIRSSEMEGLKEEIQVRSDQAILRAKLNFRSPKATSREEMYMYDSDDDNESATERNAVAVLLDAERVLILENLESSVTARLERITVYTKDNESVKAEFIGTLRDYGAFIAKLEQPLPGMVQLSTKDIREYFDQLLPAIEVRVQGDKKVTYLRHRRIPQFATGWRRQIYPQIMGENKGLFLFDQDGKLVAMPILRREKVSEKERWSYNEPSLTASVYLSKVIGDMDNHIDSNNIPLSESEENRLAWMGVELQALNKDLARAHNVSDLTKNGETGALISYVYPSSPAAEAGIEPGTILLRLYVEGEPKPLEVKLESDRYFPENFPWDQLDQIPEEYFDRIPSPWPSAENSFNRTLTNIGFGKKFTAEYVQEEERIKKEFVVTQSPPHYDSSPRYKSEMLGMTVRDLTYEVRRYFQKLPEEPGIIVSKIEQGSKASVSGIKPYEIITHVNEEPITSIKEFEKLVKEQEELRFSVKRMTVGRVVKIKLAGSPEKTVD